MDVNITNEWFDYIFSSKREINKTLERTFHVRVQDHRQIKLTGFNRLEIHESVMGYSVSGEVVKQVRVVYEMTFGSVSDITWLEPANETC